MNAGDVGRATLIALDDRTQVTVIVSGVPAEIASRPVHLYTYLDAGSCGSPRTGAGFALTERVLAQSPSGTSIVPASGPYLITNVAPLSLATLRAGGYAIRIMTSPADGNRELFCGDIR
jgi:hypothetical protein